MTAYDYFEEAKALARAFEQAGYCRDGKRIMDAMERGSTGTEIFMMLHFELSGMLKEGMILGLETRVRALRDRLAAALR